MERGGLWAHTFFSVLEGSCGGSDRTEQRGTLAAELGTWGPGSVPTEHSAHVKHVNRVLTSVVT